MENLNDHELSGYTEAGIADEVGAICRRAIRQACRDTEAAFLTGDGRSRPFSDVEKDLKAAGAYIREEIKRVQFLKSHSHEWDDHDYCIHCGADGRV